ncbi:type ISP restriction/modification enzyme [Methylotenera sp.]|uniref:type ISP restriction/modification enzyme n=1 Tax=Methylotenera sp. TaxID=2051956 RepID=UPI00272F7167|nr:type ISP restriction/modification enzyme [Methylotenera sp.]MDP2070905.1 type ISP restriction/modification enzyme [Methylotenera sp.]MDP3005779.1 type ISP restriction/modification enzyme [Methylotenera sp.]
MNIQQYIDNVSSLFNAGNSTEHSYRGDLQQLLTSLLKDVAVTNEPKRIECGAPDYILTCKDIPIGYIEAKDVGVKLGDKAHKEQFDRYKAALNNLIITDYLEFHFYKNGVLVESVSIATIGAGKDGGKIYAKPDSFDRFTALIENFASTITQTIKSPTTLAQMMAAKAKLMAQVIKSALDEDDKSQKEQAQNTTDLQGQMAAFKSILIHDINNTSFADIYAQTIAYGLFAARYHDPTLKTFSRQEAATLIPQSNPFLRKLFQYIAGYELDNRLTWLVDELVLIFLATDVASVMHNFGKSTRQHDPIIHFYETFLAEYDPKLRKSRGVWYTPEPVVSFIVRAVDDILKTHFKLPQGLADTSKTKVTIEAIEGGSKGKLVKREHELHRVQILDPATGTGTFLAQTIRHIYDSQFAKMQGAWSGYVKEHLIPRLNGFELLMTSYAMAHLKLDMLLTETGAYATTPSLRATLSKEGELKTTSERLRIYLTNSLEEHDADTGTLFASWLSTEANEANHIKRDAPVMVVMGNPPYSVSSSNKSDWIQNLLVDYKKDLNERNIQPLSDDYIKFIRFGQHFVDKNGEGILAYISNNSFIDGLIHRQMRKSLLESFDEIYILDLHGNSKKQETAPDGSKDENVFDIMQGVSINIFVKTGTSSKSTTPSKLRSSTPSNKGELKPAELIPLRNEGVAHSDGVVPLKEVPVKPLAKVFHHSLYGKRETKYGALNEGAMATFPWQELEVKAPEYFFTVKDFDAALVYEKGFKVNELFSLYNSGLSTEFDELAIKTTKSEASTLLNDLLMLEQSDISKKYTIEASKLEKLQRAISDVKKNSPRIVKINFRPFDFVYSIYTGKSNGVMGRPRNEVMQHLLDKENIGFIFKRGFDENAPPCFISKTIIDRRAWSRPGMQGAESIAPLYVFPDATDLLAETTRTPNLNMQIVDAIAQGLGLTFTTEKQATTPSLLRKSTPSTEGELKPAELIPLRNEGVARSDGVVPLEGVVSSDGAVTTKIKLNDLPYNPALKDKARELRIAGNLSEVLFWNAVKNKQLNSLDFDRQRIIGNYIVDFYCHEYALVIEIDGSSHDEKADYDAKRDAYLKALGLNVLHVQDIEVKKNLSGVIELVKQNTTTPSLRATPSVEGKLKTFAPIDLLDYIYAVLHSPSYRETYKEFLKIDFPRVPYPSDATQFWQLVALGGELRQLHLLEGAAINQLITSYPENGNNLVDKPRYEDGKVYINETQYFEGVPKLAWEFYIGGYQPAQKWLKDRKGRTLGYEDILHYQKIIKAMVETDRLMQAVDKISVI